MTTDVQTITRGDMVLWIKRLMLSDDLGEVNEVISRMRVAIGLPKLEGFAYGNWEPADWDGIDAQIAAEYREARDDD